MYIIKKNWHFVKVRIPLVCNKIKLEKTKLKIEF